MTEINRMRGGTLALAFAFAATVGGCSAGDVELNGSVFDMVGVGSKSQSASRDVKVPARQALVLPPNPERLPEPGSGAADAQLATGALPIDPEQRRVANASQAEVQHREYCEKALQKAKVNRDLSPVNGPLGRCDASILDMINVKSPVQINAGGPAAPKPQ
jgi:hypothetical protein